jgi:eukaryotic-like serine/threonine-protein kinase
MRSTPGVRGDSELREAHAGRTVARSLLFTAGMALSAGSTTRTDPANDSLHAQARRIAQVLRIGAAISLAFLVAVPVVRLAAGESLEPIFDRSWFLHLGSTSVLVLGALSVRRIEFPSPAAIVAFEVGSLLLPTLLFNASALLSGDRIATTFGIVLVSGLTMILRAAIVPSSLARTTLISITMLIASWGFIAVPQLTGWPPARNDAAWSALQHTVAAGLWLSCMAACSIFTGYVIYGLRQELKQARNIGPYLLHERLGEGGMGVVYRATHALLKRETAIKLISPDRVEGAAVERFEREVVDTARLTHPNTVAIYDYGRTREGRFYYAMEYVDGLTLDELIEVAGPLPPGRVIQILAQLCSSLEEAHALGLVHRDVKPANVIVTCRSGAPDLVKVVDFGLVKDFKVDRALSTTGQLLGTPATMSPEAITDPKRVGPASDLYAVGVVGFMLLTGRPVFEGETMVAVCAQHLYDPPPLPSSIQPGIPAALDRLIAWALSKRIEDRPASARAFKEALRACPGIEPWTEADAIAWWREVGAAAIADRQARRDPSSLERGRTLAVDATRTRLTVHSTWIQNEPPTLKSVSVPGAPGIAVTTRELSGTR